MCPVADEVLSAIQHNNDDNTLAEQLAQLLPSDTTTYNLNHMFERDPVYGTLLHLVVRKRLPKVTKLLIRKGADPNSRDLSGDKFCPLHYAAENGDAEIMKILLDGGANPNSTEGKFKQSSLHMLLKNDEWKNNEERFNNCLNVLLEDEKINADIENKDKETPLALACKRGWKYMVKQLLIKGTNIEGINNNISEKDTIFSEMLGVIEKDEDLNMTRKNNLQNKRIHYNDELKKHLKDSNTQDFENNINIMEQVVKNKQERLSILDSEEDQGKTLLQYACDNGFADFVKILLDHGANSLKYDKTNNYSPLLYAVGNGYDKIVKLLVGKMLIDKTLSKGIKHTDKRGESILHKIVKQEYPKKEANYIECLRIIVKYKSALKPIINLKDEYENSALHYAALLHEQDFARLLVVSGAHLGSKNKHGKLAIANIQPSVLKDGLDNCIEVPPMSTSGATAVNDFELRLNYSQLIGNKDSEMACIKFMSRSDTHCHLLSHPVVNTFLSLKWQKIQKYYIINFFLYLVYLGLLTAYILIYHSKAGKSESDSSNSTSVISNETKPFLSEKQYTDYEYIFICPIAFLSVCISIKECLQFCLSPSNYITSFKNLLDTTTVLMAFLLVFLPNDAINKQHLSAWLILFAWINFILILGCHPKLAIYITMFKRVSHNFILFIILFSCMILAFSFSFYLVFQVDDNFTTVPQTILKTIVMTTGELEFTDLPFDVFPHGSRLLFLLFILFIMVVLMNFITGLAVSDITIIQQEAEIYSYRNQVELISHLESVFFVDTISSAKKKSCPNSTTAMEYIKSLLSDKREKLKSLLMFPSCLGTESIKMFPNQKLSKKFTKGQILRFFLGVLPTQQRKVSCTCRESHSFNFEQSQIDSAMSVVLAEKDITENISELEGNLSDRVDLMEELLSKRINKLEEQLSACMNNLDERMNNIDRNIRSAINKS
ncbi:unnamed protein product [Meganyctiphanes norvegica]|uniref:Ion transport domain-containing protein n=1 Tax=Meganyctiphanes norvegica TaxID=48144 RepID=A0AAV2Q4C8_MEGNR